MTTSNEASTEQTRDSYNPFDKYPETSKQPISNRNTIHHTMQKKQRPLIMALRKNSRAKVNQVAKRIERPTSTLMDQLHRMEEQGVLHHRTHVDFALLGFPIRLLLTLKTRPEWRNQLQQYLETHPNINTLHIVNSGYDFHAEAIFKDQKQAEDFLDDIKSQHTILKQESSTIIRTIIAEQFLTKEEHFE